MRLGRRVTYVDRVPGSRPVTVDIRLGSSLSLYATAVGKLFVADQEALRRKVLGRPRPALTEYTLTEPADLERELGRIREQGFAVSREEAIIGVVGLAVGVRDAYGALVAALHISTLRAQITEDSQRQLIEAAAGTAGAVERELGRRPQPRPGAAAAGG